MNRSTCAYLLLILLVVGEVANVQGTIQRNLNARRQERLNRANHGDKDAEDKDDQDDPKGSFLTDSIKKYKCDKTKIKQVMHDAGKKGFRISIKELLAQFQTCTKEKEKAKEKDQGSKEDREQNKEVEEPVVPLKRLFSDNFDSWNKNNWEEAEGLYGRIVKGINGKGEKGSMLMDGNGKDGKTLKDDGVRMLTSKMFDARAGGTVQFQLRSFGTKGEGTCYTDYTKMKKEEQDKKRAIEQEQKKKAEQAAKKAAEQTAKAKKAEAEKKKKDEEKNKLEAKRMEEVKARKQCLSSPPCNGHGRGVYKSKCNEKTWECTSRQCTCNCIGNWYGQRCDKYMGTSQCQSVGDPHPLSLDGLRFNIYDAGEFLMFKHPQHPVEIHELTRMARPHIAATAGVAMRTEGTTISIEQPHCGNRNNFQVRAIENGVCRNIGWGRRYSRQGLTYDGGRHIYGPRGTDIYLGGWWRYNWWRGQCGSAYWLNIYVRIKAPRDGKAEGICGTFRGNRNTDEQTLIQSSGKRHHHQISRSTRNKWMIKPEDSFFICGAWKPSFRYSPSFKSLKAGQSLRAATQAAAMVDAEATVTREFARDRALNAANDKADAKGDDEKTPLSQAKALAICKKKPGIDTEEALTNCVNDMSMTNDKKTADVAKAESEEEAEEAVNEVKEDEKEEEIEMAAEAKMKVAESMDLVMQYCGKDCHNEKNWKQLKAYPQKVYGDFLNEWRTMTARLPDDAKTAGLRLRFFQKEHTCYCCEAYAIDNVEVTSGGMNVAIVADKKFELFADGKTVGQGEWWEPAKDTYRFKVPDNTRTFAVKLNGGNDAKMGLIGMFGEKLVTSSSWKCSAVLDEKDADTWMKPSYDDSDWGSAVEEGRNGILPWGERPGIAKQAYWIFTHEVYRMRGQNAYCRVNVKDAAHSHARTHEASRWSCKAGKNRLSPAAVQLSSKVVAAVEVRGGKEATEHFSPGTSFTTKVEDDDEVRVLMKIKTKNLFDKTVEGATIKRALLRVLVSDETENELLVCKLIRKWSAADVTWNDQPAYDGPKDKCISVKALKKNEWMSIDLSDWMREWVSNPETNFGIVFVPTGKDAASFVSYLDPDANQRPRLSMSCHGDRTDSSHVFKAVMGKLETAPRGAEPTATGAEAATGTGAEAATGPRQVVHVALPCDKPNGCPKEDEKKPEPYQRMNDKITMVKASEAATGASTGAATGASF